MHLSDGWPANVSNRKSQIALFELHDVLARSTAPVRVPHLVGGWYNVKPLSAISSYGRYIRRQNDHLSGRMTDISVMGEWQVVCVGGTRPLKNVLGEALKGRFSFEARNYLSSFQSFVHFEEFLVSHAFVRFGAKHSSSGAFGFDDVLELFLNSAPSLGVFFANSDYDHEYFLKVSFLFFFSKAEPVLLAWQAIPRLSKALLWWYVEN